MPAKDAPVTHSQPRTALRLAPDADGIARAAALLRAGRLVAFPTETVYGLGALATDQDAARAIYAAKGRPSFNPLIAHIAAPADALRWAVIPPLAARLIEAFWPGPLTLVLPLARQIKGDARIAPAVTAGGATIALRCPAHPLARALLAAVGAPVAAPSANPSGGVSPTSADHVVAGLGARIDAVIDGGPCAVGVESTIVAVDGMRARLLRPGGVTAEALAAVLGDALLGPQGEPLFSGAPATLAAAPTSAAPESPGQLASHYAPGASVRLDAAGPRPGEAWLGFGPDPDLSNASVRATLSATGDLAEAAATLFALLRDLDAALAGVGAIAVAPIPHTGLGRAINDRLRRAAAPRGDLDVRP
ncbi:MAG: L-threonylcarbamoyladenylate synthase [Paracoccaceae bacterium]|jgi:L-threonylcarbamoyladenylate synthase